MKPVLITLLTLLIVDYNEITFAQQQPGGRVAPGVPPGQYQHQQYNAPPPPHHVGQPPQQYQQQQQQFQQVPQHQPPPPQGFQGQQQQFPPPPPQHHQQAPPPQHQGVPQGHAHEHGHHGGPGQLLDASNINQERQHIQEHMEVPIDTSQMSEQELQFHYFKMHDADNNNKLDGCELVKSLIHWHDQSNHDPKAGVPIPEPKIFHDDELVNMIDPILSNDDKNGDGFIDYGEFSLAQASAAARAKTTPHA